MSLVEKLECIGLTVLSDYAWFDCENFDEPDSYETIFKVLVKASKGVMAIEDIYHEWGWDTKHEHFNCFIHFRIANDTFAFSVYCDEWFDWKFIDEVNALLEYVFKVEYRVCPINTGDQSMILAFCNPVQQRELEEAKLIMTRLEYMGEE